LKDGPANESFGIQVAKLAGLPTPVITRAWKVLAELEGGAETTPQLSLFGSRPTGEAYENSEMEGTAAGEVLQMGEENSDHASAADPSLLALAGLRTELSNLDLNSLTPLQALSKLSELQERAKK
jgi:DNA mismatch repair protein MutS